MCQLVRGVTYEILDLYRFLVTELVFLDDYLLNYMSLICHRDKILKNSKICRFLKREGEKNENLCKTVIFQ